MKRGRRILGQMASVLSLLFFLCVVLSWAACSKRSRPIWWNHAEPFPDYHIATIRNGKLILARYTETSPSPALQRLQLSADLLKLQHELVAVTERRLEFLVESKHAQDLQLSQARAVIEQARLDLANSQRDLASQHACEDLPPKAGLGLSIAENIGVRQIQQNGCLMVEPASRADNLLQRLEPLPADVKSHFAGLWLTRTSLSYGRRSIVEIPLLLILPLPLILPAMRALDYLRWRRRRTLNLCLCCGYDMRASGNRCPECGSWQQSPAM